MNIVELRLFYEVLGYFNKYSLRITTLFLGGKAVFISNKDFSLCPNFVVTFDVSTPSWKKIKIRSNYWVFPLAFTSGFNPRRLPTPDSSTKRIRPHKKKKKKTARYVVLFSANFDAWHLACIHGDLSVLTADPAHKPQEKHHAHRD